MAKSKLAIKRLTASDLTLFEWHFRNKNAGNQKAINLNRNIFVDQIYPALPEVAQEQDGRLPLDLRIYGPDGKPELNLQRKIIKFGTYKNWRLNGEFIHNPQDDLERFNALSPGDFAVFEFIGGIIPNSTRMILIGNKYQSDINLHQTIDQFLSDNKMLALTQDELAQIIEKSKPPEDHPIRYIIIGEVLEDAAQGGSEGMDRLWIGVSKQFLSRESLDKARRKAEYNGSLGEQIINDYFTGLLRKKEIDEFEWTSEDVNPVSPYDFRIIKNQKITLLDVKSTDGGFSRSLHISMNEIRQITNGEEQYDLYRVYEISDAGAKVKIASNLREFGKTILDALVKLPVGVKPDGFSFNPEILNFSEEILIEFPDIEDMD